MSSHDTLEDGETVPVSLAQSLLTDALPACGGHRQWHVGRAGESALNITLRTRSGAWIGSREVTITSLEASVIVNSVASGARALLNEVGKQDILNELVGTYEGLDRRTGA